MRNVAYIYLYSYCFQNDIGLPTVQKRTWEGNDKFIFHISDAINGHLFLLKEGHSIRRTLCLEIGDN